MDEGSQQLHYITKNYKKLVSTIHTHRQMNSYAIILDSLDYQSN